MTANKTTKGNYHVEVCLEDVFGSAQGQINASYVLGYKLISQRETDNLVLSQPPGANDAANVIQYKISKDQVL